jgi:hypothetical protein
MAVPFRSERVRWDMVGWLLALVGGLMAMFGQPADATAPSPDAIAGHEVRIHSAGESSMDSRDAAGPSRPRDQQTGSN